METCGVGPCGVGGDVAVGDAIAPAAPLPCKLGGPALWDPLWPWGGPPPPRCRRRKAGANGGLTSGSCRQEAEAGPTGAEAVTKSREAQNCTRSESRKSRESRKSGKNRKSRRKSRKSGKSRKSRRKSGERRKSGKSRKRQKVERSQKNGATKISRNPERVPNEIRKRSENLIRFSSRAEAFREGAKQVRSRPQEFAGPEHCLLCSGPAMERQRRSACLM